MARAARHEDHKKYERKVKAKLLRQSAMFPNTYELPTRYH